MKTELGMAITEARKTLPGGQKGLGALLSVGIKQIQRYETDLVPDNEKLAILEAKFKKDFFSLVKKQAQANPVALKISWGEAQTKKDPTDLEKIQVTVNALHRTIRELNASHLALLEYVSSDGDKADIAKRKAVLKVVDTRRGEILRRLENMGTQIDWDNLDSYVFE